MSPTCRRDVAATCVAAAACARRAGPPGSAMSPISVARHLSLDATAPCATRRCDLRASARVTSRANVRPSDGCVDVCQRGLRMPRCAWCCVWRSRAAAAGAHRNVELSTGQSQWPASSISRRVFLRGCGASPRGRIHQPVCWPLSPVVCRDAHASAFPVRASVPPVLTCIPRSRRVA